ncbi:hypothetical protein GCM10027589_13680 [Actinocorallia lasiicapitis]
MKNIPVDTTSLTFVCVAQPRPKLADRDTGEVKVDKDGRTVFQVGLSAVDALGRVDLLNVSVSDDPGLRLGQIVTVAGLVGSPWQREDRGRHYAGVAYKADRIVAFPVPEAAPARVAKSSG